MTKSTSGERVELKEDGWAAFERAVDAAVRNGPKHKASRDTEGMSPHSHRQKSKKKAATDD